MGKLIRDRSENIHQAQGMTKQIMNDRKRPAEMVKKINEPYDADPKAAANSISPVQEV